MESLWWEGDSEYENDKNDGDKVHNENRHLFDDNKSDGPAISKMATDHDNNKTGSANKRKTGDDDGNTDDGKEKKMATKSRIVEYSWKELVSLYLVSFETGTYE